MNFSVRGVVGIILFVAVSGGVIGLQYGLTGTLSVAAVGLVLGAVFAYMESPHNDWRPRNPLWVIAPLVGGISLVAAVWGLPLSLGAFAFLAALFASPRMWGRWVWLTLASIWMVFMVGFVGLALLIAW